MFLRLPEANDTTGLDEGLNSVDTDNGPEFGPELINGMSRAEILQVDKNAARNRRLKLKGMALKFGLSDEEVKVLTSAGLMMPDIFDAILIDDVNRRNMVVEESAGNRVQYTNLMAPPLDIEAYIDGRVTIKIDSKPYIENAKSLSELMIAVRGSSKMLDGIASASAYAYAEQKALHGHLLRQVVERQQMARAMRNSPPSYLIDFARLMEMLGCQRNHLRSADGRLVSMIKRHLGLDNDANDANDADGDDEADYFKSWLAEENALAGDDSDLDMNSEDINEFDRLSRIAARALMDGDLVRAKSAFADLESYDALIEGSFGADSIDDDDALDDDKIVSPGGGADAPLPVESISAVPAHNPATEQSEALLLKPVRLMDWGERVAPDSDHGRVDGYGRIDSRDAFGGIVSLASGVPDVIPMWARKDRPRSTGRVLGLNDWYRFEVPVGNYALVHMPRKLPEFSPVTDNMFPPYIDIVRYGEEADFSLSEMQSMLKESDTLGGAQLSIRAIRFVVVKRYGKDDEVLVRFWAFLVLGRVFMDRIDILFPDGYFHGVIAPDAGAEQAGVGYFSIVRVLNDRKLSNKMRTPRFAPFDSLELVSSLD